MVTALVSVMVACGTDEAPGQCQEGAIVDNYICENGEFVEYSGPCAGVNCSFDGDCVEVDGSAQCDCDDGFVAQGLECVPESAPDPCDDFHCGSHGSCELDTSNNPFCDCDDGYEDHQDTCVPSGDPCSAFACEPHGTCLMDSQGSASCHCDDGYEPQGISCAPADPCDDVDCGPGGDCFDDDGSAACDCDADHEPDGLYCSPVDICDDVDCGSHGHCFDDDGSPGCDCDDGYEADGLNCVPGPQCVGVNDSCTVHVLGPTGSSYQVTDYEQTDLFDALDGPIVAAFGLEETDRGYLLTQSSYYRIDTSNFSLLATGPVSDIDPRLADVTVVGALSIPERHPDGDSGNGNDQMYFMAEFDENDFSSEQLGDIDPNEVQGIVLVLDYNYSQGSFESVDGAEDWIIVVWDQGPATAIPDPGQDIIALWLDDENYRGFMTGSIADACDDSNAPANSVGIVYQAVLTAQTLHFAPSTHCFPFIERQWNSSAEVFNDFSDAPTPDDVGAAIWHNRTLYFFSRGYYEHPQ